MYYMTYDFYKCNNVLVSDKVYLFHATNCRFPIC